MVPNESLAKCLPSVTLGSSDLKVFEPMGGIHFFFNQETQ